MEKQKKKDAGITLVALVVSIIVMLVLAGVSLNATIGENGIVTRAQEAALKQRVAEELENLNLELTKMNVDTIATDETMAIQEIANYLINQGVIDGVVKTSSNQIAAGIDTATGNKYFFGTKGDNTYRITRGKDGLLSAELTTYSSGGDITGGYALITADSFNNDDSLSEEEKGKFTITSDAEVVFMDTISGALSIYVKSGVHATVGIYAKMELTNKNISRSAIDIEPGGILDMYIGDGVEVTVNSGFGLKGQTAKGKGGVGGPGGYAGIHVPKYLKETTIYAPSVKENGDYNLDTNGYVTFTSKTYPAGTAELNLYGSGTLIAYGGKAGDGGAAISGNTGGGGGGGAGAGIGGNGGMGGIGNSSKRAEDGYISNYQCAEEGYSGEDCGTVNIHGSLTVCAYGGAGGNSGIKESNLSQDSGFGGGGYPAAGIGGGGAGGGGGDHCNGGGGYTGGYAQAITKYNSQGNPGKGNSGGGGASYTGYGQIQLASESSSHNILFGKDNAYTAATLGGQGGKTVSGYWISENNYHIIEHGGDGGVAGKGGEINVSKNTQIQAYNGNSDTETSNYGNITTQTQIFAQNGNLRAVYKYNDLWNKDNYKLTYDYWKEILGDAIPVALKTEEGIGYNGSTTSEIYKLDKLKNLLLRAEDNCLLSGYKNPINNEVIYGVGSGAGYVELLNGTYTRYNEDSNGNFTTVYTGE